MKVKILVPGGGSFIADTAHPPSEIATRHFEFRYGMDSITTIINNYERTEGTGKFCCAWHGCTYVNYVANMMWLHVHQSHSKCGNCGRYILTKSMKTHQTKEYK